MKIFMLSLFLLLLVACGSNEAPRHVVDTVDVNIPILERAEAPKELYRTKVSSNELPKWLAPSDPLATVCVSAQGEPILKRLLLNRESLLDGWEAYGR